MDVFTLSIGNALSGPWKLGGVLLKGY